MANSKLKLYIVAVPLIGFLFVLFIRYVPWLFDSKPIDTIGDHDLSNLPPPDWAMSFAINHGEALYYYAPVPSQSPIQTTFVVLAFFLSFACLGFIGRRLQDLSNNN